MEEGDEIYALRRLTGGGGDEDEEPNTGDSGGLINLKVKGQVNSFLYADLLDGYCMEGGLSVNPFYHFSLVENDYSC
nr:hypothetical protein [Tanacetum cinerariifolium]